MTMHLVHTVLPISFRNLVGPCGSLGPRFPSSSSSSASRNFGRAVPLFTLKFLVRLIEAARSLSPTCLWSKAERAGWQR